MNQSGCGCVCRLLLYPLWGRRLPGTLYGDFIFYLFFVANYYTNYDECSQVEMFSSYALYS